MTRYDIAIIGSGPAGLEAALTAKNRNKSILMEEIRKMIGADTLGYLSVEGVKKMAADADCDFCVGCFTEKYPSAVPENTSKDRFEQKIGEPEKPYKGVRRFEDGEEL